MRAAWEEQDQALEAEDPTFFVTTAENFQELLKTKKSLRYVHIPAFMLAETMDDEDEDANMDDDEHSEQLLEKLADNIDEDFLIDAMEWMALSLLRDDWTDAEGKTLLTALSWAINDSNRHMFLTAVLEKTIDVRRLPEDI